MKKLAIWLVAILPLTALGGGGGDADGVDILPQAPSTYSLNGAGSGLTLVVGPPVSDGNGGQTVSVTVTGTVDRFGGNPIESKAVDVPYNPDGSLTFGVELTKRSPGDCEGSCEETSSEEVKDKNKVDLDIDTPWSELNDGDDEDDDVGYASGYNPILGWGGGPVHG